MADPSDLLNIDPAPPPGLVIGGTGIVTSDEEGSRLADINSISIGERVESISKSSDTASFFDLPSCSSNVPSSTTIEPNLPHP